MPKARETCTECSKSRQKCDRGVPCGRCIKRGKADLCTIVWPRERNLQRKPPPPRSHRESTSSAQLASQVERLPGLTSFVDDEPDREADNEVSTLDFMTWTPTQQMPGTNARKSSLSTLLTSSMHAGGQKQNLDFSSLQLLLPNVRQTWRLVNFHEKRLLWYHGCYHGPSFNTQLEKRLQRQNLSQDDVLRIDAHDAHDAQWVALLFSILAGSLTSASENLLTQWGFTREESLHLCTQWYAATTTALKLGSYTSDHAIEGVQAIATLTMSAHTLGFSGDLHIHLGAALRIAQSLNLHRIREDDIFIDENSTSEVRQVVLKREVGRRLWSQLCIQDWFSIPLAEAHSIHRGHFSTTKPGNRDHLSMVPLPESIPTYVSYSNYLYDVAALIAELHAATTKQNTDFTRYRLVLEYDLRMRELATKGRPRYFDAVVETEQSWPWFVPWARRSLTICFAHKVMMIHRSFLKRSFTNEAFSMTRRTCIAAAKTILNEARQGRDRDDPVIWIDHAFCIAAAITLALDASHRSPSEPEYKTHRNLVTECIQMLCEQVNSTLASRGVCLLHILLDKSVRIQGSIPPSSPEGRNVSGLNTTIHTAASMLDLIHNADFGREERTQSHGSTIMEGGDHLAAHNLDNMDNIFAELFPAQAGFSNVYLFEDLLGMSIDR